jgi:hypothetical protein
MKSKGTLARNLYEIFVCAVVTSETVSDRCNVARNCIVETDHGVV